MEMSHWLVGGMTGAAAVFLVWLELHSRRNAKRRQEPPTGERS
jgi:hypothetical protein